MKNDIIRFENNVPDNYLVGSRDYQALLRLFTFGISSIKFDVDNIRYVNDASHINSRLLNLLKLKVGFFTKEEFKDQYIREVLKVFSLIVKKKGTRQAIYDAINLYFRACRYNGDYVVEINNKDDIQPYMIRIGVTKESNDILLLEEILKYILPTGYLYEVFKYSTAKYKSNYYTQDQLTLSVVDDYNGSNIHDNSSNIFIEKLFEGTSVGPAAIASFSDGAENTPLKSAVVNIEPVQDLHGYDSPWPAGGGKNKFETKNVGRTDAGVTYALESDGKIKLTGTASATSYLYTQPTYNMLTLIPAGSYILSGGLSSNIRLVATSYTVGAAPNYTVTKIADIAYDYGNGATFTLSSDTYVGANFRIQSGQATNVTVGIQIETGSTKTAWTPYSNICPISGWSQVDVTRTGKNLFGKATGAKNLYVGGGNVTGTGGTLLCFYAKKGVQYTINMTGGNRTNLYCYDGSVSDIVAGITLTPVTLSAARPYTFIADQNATYCYYAATYYQQTVADSCMVNVGSTALPYSSYAGTPITISLGQTVYGGTLDVVRGKLTITHGIKTYDGSSDEDWRIWDGNRAYYTPTGITGYKVEMISNSFKWAGRNDRSTGKQIGEFIANAYGGIWNGNISFFYDESTDHLDAFKAWMAQNPIQVVYTLKSPIEVDLTPQTIKTLLGTNNIWCNTGDTSLEYLSETSGGSYITYYNVYNNVTDNYINILTYPSIGNINIYNGDFTVSVSETDFDLDNANMYVLIHQYLKDDRIVCSKTTWSISYDAQTDSITATSGNNEINISYSNFIRNLPLLEDHEIPSSFTLEYENESVSTEGFVLQDDNRSFTFIGYDGNKIIVKYETDSQYLGKRIDNIVVYKNGWENESD